MATVAVRGALVMTVPDNSGSGAAGRQEQVTIRVPDRAAATIAAAADGGKVWLVLRPPVGARAHGADGVVTGASNGQPVNADINIKVRGR